MSDPSGAVPSIAPDDLQARLDRGDTVRVLDLRNRDEVDRWRIAGPSVTHTQKPANRFLQARVTDAVDEFVDDVDGEGPITVVCARGEASAEVAGHLVDAGHDARNLAGGMERWARLALVAELDGATTPADATVVQFRRPASGCLSYLAIADGEAAVVDPLRAFADRYVDAVRDRDADLRWVVDTHVHADHVSGLRAVAETTDATPVMPAPAVERGVAFDVETVADGESLSLGTADLEAVHAPGHTTGMTAFDLDGALLTGDSLFVDGVARPDLERGDEGARELARDLHRTLIERFDRFPDETVIAPGHHGERPDLAEDGSHTASLGDLRALPAFAMTAEEFVDYVTGDLPPRPPNHETIVAVNLGREAVDGETAFELELGPNNCAATPVEQ